jgi:hypothetical protein
LGLGQEQEHIKTVADTEGQRGHGFRAQGTSAWSNNENKSRNMCNLARIGEENKKKTSPTSSFYFVSASRFPLFLRKKCLFFASQEAPLALPRMTSASK